jgi:crotonobetainyl-CoA:carnitine CoA-transferase CaiB-like acyl-CoA transferase
MADAVTVPAFGGSLDGYRILDLTTEPGFLAGKLLAELGADVIKIEPSGGDAARRRGPFVGGRPDPERSVLWLALNTSKRGITLNLDDARGRDIFLRLCRQADAVIESAGPAERTSLVARGLPYETLRAANPQLVMCSLSAFGQSGPYSTFRASDITAVAMGGNLYPTGNPDRAPLRCSLPVTYYHGGLEAAVAVVFALWGRETTGEGQLVDVSLQEAMMMPNMTSPAQFPLTGFKGGRMGGGFRGGRAAFRELWPCADGYVSFALRGGPARIPGLVAMVKYVDEHGMAPDALKRRDWSAYNHNLVTQAEVDEIEAALGAFFRSKTMSELFTAACERNLMLAPANTAREIRASRQLAARDFFVEIEDPGRDIRLTYPGAFAKVEGSVIAVRGPAPRLGEHNAAVYGALGLDVAALAFAGVI